MKLISPLFALLLVAVLSLGLPARAQESRPEGRPEGERGERGERERGERGERGERERNFARMNPLLTALDTNSDGTIDEKELAGAVAALQKLDKNHDGKLSPEELRPAFPQRGGGNADEMVNRVLQFDKNADGKLSKDELPERLQSMLERGDTDKDGFLSKDELRKLLENRNAAAPGRGEGRERRD